MVKEEVYKLIYELAFYAFLFKAENRGQASKPQEVEVKSLFSNLYFQIFQIGMFRLPSVIPGPHVGARRASLMRSPSSVRLSR